MSQNLGKYKRCGNDTLLLDVRVEQISELFLEFLILSLIENAYDNNPNLFIDTKINNRFGDVFPILSKEISQFLTDSPLPSNASVVDYPQICDSLSRLLGAYVAAEMPLKLSQKGQVSYMPVLDTLETGEDPVFMSRVFPGSLQFEEARYLYAQAEDNTDIGDTLDFTKVSPQDFSLHPFKATVRPSRSTWLCSPEDDHLNIYLVPDVNKDFSINPQLIPDAHRSVVFLKRCRPKCPNIDDFRLDLLYCKTIGATLSHSKAQIFRIYSCFGSPADLLFAQAVLERRQIDIAREKLEISPDDVSNDNGFPDNRTVMIVRGSSCLACVCQTGLDMLDEYFPESDLGRGRVIILD